MDTFSEEELSFIGGNGPEITDIVPIRLTENRIPNSPILFGEPFFDTIEPELAASYSVDPEPVYINRRVSSRKGFEETGFERASRKIQRDEIAEALRKRVNNWPIITRSLSYGEYIFIADNVSIEFKNRGVALIVSGEVHNCTMENIVEETLESLEFNGAYQQTKVLGAIKELTEKTDKLYSMLFETIDLAPGCETAGKIKEHFEGLQ
jgi:hypothetical protein